MQISLLIQTRTLFHWRKSYYGLWTLCILVKNVLMLDLFHLLSSPDVNWWTGVVWIIVMFLSDSHSDGTHSLQSIHCWDTDAETHFSKSDEETNSSWSQMTWGLYTLPLKSLGSVRFLMFLRESLLLIKAVFIRWKNTVILWNLIAISNIGFLF